MHVYLVGFMGSGKTRCGRHLAALLDRPFVDLDDEIVHRAGMDIPGIFAGRGEEAFRRLEERALAELPETPPLVVATGGGVVTRDENLERMRETGFVFWLHVPFAELAERVAGDGSTSRPLFSDRETARTLWEERMRCYRAAGTAVELDGTETPGEVADRVRALLEERECAT